MNTRKSQLFEVVSLDAVDNILSRDAEVGTGSGFLAINRLNAYVGINSWVLLIRAHAGDVYVEIVDALLSDGLRQTVQRFCDSADILVRGGSVEDGLVQDVINRVCIYPRSFPTGVVPSLLSVQLTLCTYLKRLTLQQDTNVRERALYQFAATQFQVGAFWRKESDVRDGAVELVRDVLHRALDWDAIVQKILSRDQFSHTFTSGSAADADAILTHKMLRLAAVDPTFFRPIFGCFPTYPERDFYCEFLDRTDWAVYGLGGCRMAASPCLTHTVKVSTAPKALKGPRIIAMEPVEFQTEERWVKDILYRHFPAGMDLTDQSLNQDLAITGALTGDYATLDLSSASDYVSKRLVYEVFPDAFVDAVWKYSPGYFRLPFQDFGSKEGVVLPLQSFATMGNGLTFWIESLVFWAIATVACDIEHAYGDIRVYGDDIVLPTKAAKTCVALLGILGFHVNTSKSFIDGLYRESCGVEACGGDIIDRCYYPRFPIVGEIDSVSVSLSADLYPDKFSGMTDATASLIALQHRLFNLSREASKFVAAVVTDAHPKMTSSRWGDPTCPDLWASTCTHGITAESYGYSRWFRGHYQDYRYGQECARRIQVLEQRGGEYSSIISLLNDVVMAAPQMAWTIPDKPTRPVVCRPIMRYAPVDELTAEKSLFDSYAYWHFLEHGPEPLYPDDPDPIRFSMTKRSLRFREACQKPVVEWVLKPDLN